MIIKDLCMETSAWCVPKIDCDHVWLNDGLATKTWTDTATMFPVRGVVTSRKQKCYICGGEQWLITGDEV